MVTDDEFNNDLPTVEGIYHANSTTVSHSVDPFAQPAEVIKSYGGTSSNFKRKVSNELRKYNRSEDHTVSSKQLDDGNTLSGYDLFEVINPPHNLDTLVKLYELNSTHYAAVNAKVANIVGLGYRLEETPATKRAIEDLEGKKLAKFRSRLNAARDELLQDIEAFNEENGFTETLIRMWRDYEVTGNGYLEIGRRRDGTVGYIGHIPAQTIRVRRKRDGFVQVSGKDAQFFRNFGDTNKSNPIGGDSDPNEILHFFKYSPTNTYYGVPDIVAASEAIAGTRYATSFNLDYFENKAVPRHIITLKGANLPKAAQMDLLSFFETGLKGQNHRSLFIPLPADGPNGEKVEFKIDPVEAGTQDSSFINYLKQNKVDVLMAHRVPITKVSMAEGASLAVAKDADKTFKEQVCGPEQGMANKKINRIVKEMTDAFEFKLNEMTLTDEDTQSKIDDRDRKAGIKTANEVRTARGMPSIEGGDELFDLNGKVKEQNSTLTEETANRQRDTTRTASGTDSNGTARNPQGEGRTDGTS